MNVRTTFLGGILTAAIGVQTSPAGAQTISQSESSRPAITVYVQVADARFDSYLHVERHLSANNEADSSDEFFYIPRANSKDREKEFADWRRKFNLIVSAATL